ncbi:uncharacterized protein PV07_09256 [Cladophialophora immunda]|uniref:Uncharacterized protein n=1 Tax=Cladophialophora immunda TaxID=569365 RepID=A0A0D2AM22_9EURO|nr:uncharacterized protein PV07_09256 [Cladophialophora immunda]KIW26132.1 hypothetical protein PV07_09256 [Cladophialophora immunda]
MSRCRPREIALWYGGARNAQRPIPQSTSARTAAITYARAAATTANNAPVSLYLLRIAIAAGEPSRRRHIELRVGDLLAAQALSGGRDGLLHVQQRLEHVYLTSLWLVLSFHISLIPTRSAKLGLGGGGFCSFGTTMERNGMGAGTTSRAVNYIQVTAATWLRIVWEEVSADRVSDFVPLRRHCSRFGSGSHGLV